MALTTTTLVLLVIIIPSSLAQDSPQDYLKAVNEARAAVGVPPMTWNDTLVAYAQDYANKRSADCAAEHSGGPYGETLAMNPAEELTGTQAVKLWVDEQEGYDYNSNTCASDKVCGHYTQVVWKDTVRIGCAKVKCKSGGTFITCNYDPPGNYVGEKPY